MGEQDNTYQTITADQIPADVEWGGGDGDTIVAISYSQVTPEGALVTYFQRADGTFGKRVEW